MPGNVGQVLRGNIFGVGHPHVGVAQPAFEARGGAELGGVGQLGFQPAGGHLEQVLGEAVAGRGVQVGQAGGFDDPGARRGHIVNLVVALAQKRRGLGRNAGQRAVVGPEFVVHRALGL